MFTHLLVILAVACESHALQSATEFGSIPLQQLPAKHRRKSLIWFGADINTTHIEVTIQGPTDRWFSVGFGRRMYPTNAIVYSSGKNGEYPVQLRDYFMTSKRSRDVNIEQHQPWAVRSNTVSNGKRVIVALRAVSILGRNKFQFDPTAKSLELVWAHGRHAGSHILDNHGHFKGRHIRLNFVTRPPNMVDSSYYSQSSSKDSNNLGYNIRPRNLDDDDDEGGEGGSGSGGGSSMAGVSSGTCTHGQVKILGHQFPNSGITCGLMVDCDKKTITVTLKGPSNQWFGILFGTSMSNADSLIYTTGKSGADPVALYDYILTGRSYGGVNRPAQQFWAPTPNSSKVTSGGMTTVSYTRGLTTSNSQQRQFDLSHLIIDVMWAKGSGLTLTKHISFTRTVTHFDLIKGKIYGSSNGADTFHSLLMGAAWAILLPIGIFASRNREFVGNPRWFFLHKYLNGCSAVLAVAGLIAAIIFVASIGLTHFSGTHELLGLFLLMFMIVQPINGYFRPMKEEHSRTRARQIWEYIHKIVGWALLGLAQYEIYIGFDVMFPNGTTAWRTVHLVYCGIIGTVALGFEMYKCYAKRDEAGGGIPMRSINGGYTRQEESISVENYEGPNIVVAPQTTPGADA